MKLKNNTPIEDYPENYTGFYSSSSKLTYKNATLTILTPNTEESIKILITYNLNFSTLHLQEIIKTTTLPKLPIINTHYPNITLLITTDYSYYTDITDSTTKHFLYCYHLAIQIHNINLISVTCAKLTII